MSEKQETEPKIAKEAEAISWDIFLVDLIVSNKIRRKGHDGPLILKELTMIYLATGWFEIVRYNDKQAATISNIVEQQCLCRHPCPTIFTYDRGTKFLGHAYKNDQIEREYGIFFFASMENPQENSILERIHQVISNIVRTFVLKIFTWTRMTLGQLY